MSENVRTALMVAAISLATYAVVAYVQKHVMMVPIAGNYLPKGQ